MLNLQYQENVFKSMKNLHNLILNSNIIKIFMAKIYRIATTHFLRVFVELKLSYNTCDFVRAL